MYCPSCHTSFCWICLSCDPYSDSVHLSMIRLLLLFFFFCLAKLSDISFSIASSKRSFGRSPSCSRLPSLQCTPPSCSYHGLRCLPSRMVSTPITRSPLDPFLSLIVPSSYLPQRSTQIWHNFYFINERIAMCPF
jgi:hypothetical protein